LNGSDFWVANIPFTNGADSKKRPILLLWLDGEDVVAAAVTSAKLMYFLMIGLSAVCALLQQCVCLD